MLLTIVEILGALVATAVVGVILYLLGTNWIRPDLLRFEPVGLTARPTVLNALEDRLTALKDLPASALANIPDQHDERAQFEGRDVLLRTTRAHLPNGTVQILVTACVKEPRGLFMRPVGVAARGFRMEGETRILLTDEELRELAWDADATPLYVRSRAMLPS